MPEILSAGVVVTEVDASTIVPTVSNSISVFSGDFVKGPVDTFTLTTSVSDLISYYGYPTNTNYNDWYQAYNFLQYGNKLLLSRAANVGGTATAISGCTYTAKGDEYTASGATFVSVDGGNQTLVTVSDASFFAVNDVISFDGTNTYTVSVVDVVTDIITLTVALAEVITVGDVIYDVAIDVNNVFELSTITGIAVGDFVVFGDVVAGTQPEVLEIVKVDSLNSMVTLDRIVADGDLPTALDVVSTWIQSINGFAEALDNVTTVDIVDVAGTPTDMTYAIPATVVTNTYEYFKNMAVINNASDYESKEASIAFTNASSSKLKFLARNPGAWSGNLEISVAAPASFEANTVDPATHEYKFAFEGIAIDDLFEYAPTGTEFGIVVKYNDEIVETWTVDLDTAAKDHNNKSTYVETVINNQSSYIFVKDNTTNTNTVGDYTLFYDTATTSYVGKTITLEYANDSVIQTDDLLNAFDIFSNKEELDVDIVIANELDGGLSAKNLCDTRKDCIGFIGAEYADVVGKKSAAAISNLVAWRKSGSINYNNMFVVACGNYKYQYDRYNDKYRWINIAGDIAGLRAQTSMNRASWWASAGLERGQIKNVTKLAFNPTNGQRDMLYKNGINPIVAFPGQGTVMWGQKTLLDKPSSFDRVNVRGLFNTMERALSKMAKYQIMEFNDNFTRNRIISMIKPYLSTVQAGRGIQDFLVICDESNNTPDVISRNQLIVDIYIKPTYVAEFIQLRFTNAGTNSFAEVIGS